MFGRFEEEITERFEEKFTSQNQKIVDLEEKLLFKRKRSKIFKYKMRYAFHLLELIGDTEFNPGPKPDSSQSFSICH